jgi:alkylation response protein AidB-like acyl-CoA dehydrogenase
VDLRWDARAEEFRARIRAFLAEHLPAGWAGFGALPPAAAQEFLAWWRPLLAENRLIGLAWPVEYGGGGLTKLEQVVLVEEFAAARVPLGPPSDTITVKQVGNTLLTWGTDAQKQHFVPRIISGADHWCQGYSEPDAGSDLASLRTTAVLDGNQWVINGQKIWTSSARNANWIFLLARTDLASNGNRGISFLLCPMDTAGLVVRPIRQINGDSEFCEVFFDNVRTEAELVVGGVNNGWKVATALLGHERGEEAATNPILFRHELNRLIELARAYGRINDPIIRDRLAWCHTKVEIMRMLGNRILAQYLRDGELGPAASISKLYWSEYHRRASELAMDIMGVRGLVPEGDLPARWFRTDEPGAPNSTASWQSVFLLNALSGTVYAGTSEVQRNILSETVLGLPREPRPAVSRSSAVLPASVSQAAST